jgi:hypothetical protein
LSSESLRLSCLLHFCKFAFVVLLYSCDFVFQGVVRVFIHYSYEGFLRQECHLLVVLFAFVGIYWSRECISRRVGFAWDVFDSEVVVL